MSNPESAAVTNRFERLLLYHFCRVQLPALRVPTDKLDSHLQRTYALYRSKAGPAGDWDGYFENIYPLDWFLVAACLEGEAAAWQRLFAARASRGDCLLIDALRARAVRLFPRDLERQESAVAEFWSHLLVADTPGTPSVLARYDGQRPLVPWLIRVFQNWHISQLRHRSGQQTLPEDDLSLPLPVEQDGYWHEAFRAAAREALAELNDAELLILGLRLRYRLSQREVAGILGVHEGTVSRQTTQLRDRCLDEIGRRLAAQGWTGEDLSELVRSEMGSVLLDEPRLSAARLGAVLAARGKSLPRGTALESQEDH